MKAEATTGRGRAEQDPQSLWIFDNGASPNKLIAF
jgi:hypothetical protein